MKGERLERISKFWITPALAGVFLAIGYCITNRALVFWTSAEIPSENLFKKDQRLPGKSLKALIKGKDLGKKKLLFNRPQEQAKLKAQEQAKLQAQLKAQEEMLNLKNALIALPEFQKDKESSNYLESFKENSFISTELETVLRKLQQP